MQGRTRCLLAYQLVKNRGYFIIKLVTEHLTPKAEAKKDSKQVCTLGIDHKRLVDEGFTVEQVQILCLWIPMDATCTNESMVLQGSPRFTITYQLSLPFLATRPVVAAAVLVARQPTQQQRHPPFCARRVFRPPWQLRNLSVGPVLPAEAPAIQLTALLSIFFGGATWIVNPQKACESSLREVSWLIWLISCRTASLASQSFVVSHMSQKESHLCADFFWTGLDFKCWKW